ncbi:unnamed protein product [Heterosigma akashiwo]
MRATRWRTLWRRRRQSVGGERRWQSPGRTHGGCAGIDRGSCGRRNGRPWRMGPGWMVVVLRCIFSSCPLWVAFRTNPATVIWSLQCRGVSCKGEKTGEWLVWLLWAGGGRRSSLSPALSEVVHAAAGNG